MPLCYGWLQSPATSSSTKKVLNVPQRARLRAFLACILVAADFAHPRYEVHFCYALLINPLLLLLWNPNYTPAQRIPR